MADISLITSLYRADAYLEAYSRHVLDVAAELQTAGLNLEMVLVANEPSDRERALIRQLTADLDAIPAARAVVLDVPRESVYASWNRGVKTSVGRVVGFWNVDDIRTADALIEGHRMIMDGTNGCAAVYFPYRVRRQNRMLDLFTIQHYTRYPAPPFDRDAFTRKMHGASFWLMGRDLYKRVGPFDAGFHISGDFEWCARAAQVANFCPGTENAGVFVLHGGNLSDSGDPRQGVEENVIHLRRGAWDRIEPAQPDLMRDCWLTWGRQESDPPPEIQDQLWGPGADERWQTWQRDQRTRQRRKRVERLLRAGPRFVIDRVGLRPWLARLGLVKSG
ncbi:MAG: hypothetical protein JXQ72_10030 [Anaerolineae bacterium]|nr:hypothetical protein [Anaerolineae bacterium]